MAFDSIGAGGAGGAGGGGPELGPAWAFVDVDPHGNPTESLVEAEGNAEGNNPDLVATEADPNMPV